MKKQILYISVLIMFLTSCTVGKNFEKPQFKFEDKWAAKDYNLGKIDFEKLIDDKNIEKWWENFNDPILTGLIDEALSNNKDIAIATERITEVRALREVEGSNNYPSISANSSAEKQGLSNRTRANNNSGEKERNSFSTSLDASWEIDFFGKTKRAIEAAEANIEVQQEVKHGVLLTVTAELASNYFELRGLQKEIDFTKRNIELLKEIEKLADTQFKSGVVTELDVNRAKGERQEFEATLPELESEMMTRIYRISVLTSKSPEAQISKLKEYSEMSLPEDLIPVGLRSEILRRRPDIRQAERELAAQTAYVGVSEGALYPSFSIIGGLGSSASRISDLFNPGSGFYSLGSIIDWDILQGGALRANVFAAESRERQAQLSYDKTILLALEDVESSLIRYGKEWQTLNKLKQAKLTREESFKIAKYRYEEGVENFETVLDAERTLINIKEKIIESETKILVNLTQIYKSLGGGWSI